MGPVFFASTLGALTAAALIIGPASAQDQGFEKVVYLSCLDAQAMTVEQRKAVAEQVAEHAARHHGVPWPLPAELADDAGLMVRGICTMYPDGNLFAIIIRAIETTFVGGDQPS